MLEYDALRSRVAEQEQQEMASAERAAAQAAAASLERQEAEIAARKQATLLAQEKEKAEAAAREQASVITRLQAEGAAAATELAQLRQVQARLTPRREPADESICSPRLVECMKRCAELEGELREMRDSLKAQRREHETLTQTSGGTQARLEKQLRTAVERSALSEAEVGTLAESLKAAEARPVEEIAPFNIFAARALLKRLLSNASTSRNSIAAARGF